MGSPPAYTVEQALADADIKAALPYAGKNYTYAIAEGANCRGALAEMFPAAGGSPTAGKRLCRACDVKPMCLAAALDGSDQIGIFGGMTKEDRKRWRPAWDKLTGHAKRPGGSVKR